MTEKDARVTCRQAIRVQAFLPLAKLLTGTRCSGIDIWQGDEHAEHVGKDAILNLCNGSEIIASVDRHVPRYGM